VCTESANISEFDEKVGLHLAYLIMPGWCWCAHLIGCSDEYIQRAGHPVGTRVGTQGSTTMQEVQRPLLTPDECLRMPGPQKNGRDLITAPGDSFLLRGLSRDLRARVINPLALVRAGADAEATAENGPYTRLVGGGC